MSLRVPLTVRLSTSRADRHITGDLQDLTFRSVVPGGFASASFALKRPLLIQPDEIAYYGRVYVYDTRNGNTVWEGRLEDPGRAAGSDGQVWSLTAVGPSAHQRDVVRPLIYVDRSLEAWEPSGLSTEHTSKQIEVAQDFNSQPVVWLKALSGTWGQGKTASLAYIAIWRAGQKLGAISASGDCGKTTSGIWKWRIVTRSAPPTGTGTAVRSVDFTTTSFGGVQLEVGNEIPDGDVRAEIWLEQTNATNQTGDENTWCVFGNLYVMAKLFDKAGAELGAAYDYHDGYVYAHEVVADLLGRRLNQYDGANAVIATTSHTIDQLAYPDGVSAEQVFADLATVEPAFYPAAWESNSAGKYRFEYVAWPTTVRYEADVTDGIDSPASADGLYNAVSVRWRDANGIINTNRRTQSVPELTAAGLTREELIDLGDEAGSSTNADRAGDEFLAQHQTPPNAGTLTISRPIRDMVLGRMVAPWEIRPGNLIRVRGIRPRVDSLNVSDRDGVAVFRTIAADYSSAQATATLELDSYPLTVSRALAELAKIPVRR